MKLNYIVDVDVEVCDDAMSSSEEDVDVNETNELSFRLRAVLHDINEHLKENDPSYVNGVAKFLKS